MNENDAQQKPPWHMGLGDDGYTGLLGPGRVPKYDLRPEALGTVDEAQAALGLARAAGCSESTEAILRAIQGTLSGLMAELAASGTEGGPVSGRIGADHVRRLEEWLVESQLASRAPKGFVLPGASAAGAALHLARTVVRRAERRVARLVHEGMLSNTWVLRYLNRLSTLLFLLACAQDESGG